MQLRILKIVISIILLLSGKEVGAYSNFYYGHCTWYVAREVGVEWRGNAKDWLGNARAVGYETGYYPKRGAIIVFYGDGYDSRYGHVGIVKDVRGEYIVVSEMNYRKIGQVTYRKLKHTNLKDIGYIYK